MRRWNKVPRDAGVWLQACARRNGKTARRAEEASDQKRWNIEHALDFPHLTDRHPAFRAWDRSREVAEARWKRMHPAQDGPFGSLNARVDYRNAKKQWQA